MSLVRTRQRASLRTLGKTGPASSGPSRLPRESLPVAQSGCVIHGCPRRSCSSSGPAPGWPGWPPRLRPLPLRRSGGLNPGPSLEGGLEELLDLLLLGKDQRSDAAWCCQPIRFWNPGRRRAHRAEVRGEPSRPLNAYRYPCLPLQPPGERGCPSKCSASTNQGLLLLMNAGCPERP
jgi:hypothetical protein